MPTQLTTPEVRQAVITATVDSWGIQFDRNPDLSVNQAKSILVAKVTLRDASGAEIDSRTLRRELSALPAGVRADIKTLHTTLIAALRAAGVLPAGTDTADL